MLRTGAQLGQASLQGAVQGEIQQQKQQMQQLQQQHLLQQMANQSERMRLQQENFGLQQDKFGLQQEKATSGEKYQQQQVYGRIAGQAEQAGNTGVAAEMHARELGGTGQPAPANLAEQRAMLMQQWGKQEGAPMTGIPVPLKGWQPPSNRYPFPGVGGAPSGEITAQRDIRKPAAAALSAIQRVLAKGATAIWKDPAKKQEWSEYVQQVTPAMAHPITTEAELQAVQALIPHGEGLLTGSQPAVAAEAEREAAGKRAETKQAATEKHQAQVEARQEKQHQDTLKHWQQIEGREAANARFRREEFEWRKKAHNETIAKTKKADVFSPGEKQRIQEWRTGLQQSHAKFNTLMGRYKNEFAPDWNPLYPNLKNTHERETSDAYLEEKGYQDRLDKAFAAKGLPIERPRVGEPPTPKPRVIEERTPGKRSAE